jgi:hypothetical protein
MKHAPRFRMWPAICLLAACARHTASDPASDTERGGAARPALETRGAALVSPVPAPSPAARTEPTLPAELSFVPGDVEAVIRVDLAAISVGTARPAESLRTIDFILRAQQPAAWEVLHGAGIAAGKDLTTLYLVVADDALLVAGLGPFDSARLGAALRRTHPTVEPGPAPAGQTTALMSWPPDRSAASHEPAAVGLGDRIVLFGTPALVRRALAARAGLVPDVRTSALAKEIAALDLSATIWGAALPLGGASGVFPRALPGFQRARLQADLASPGTDPAGADGVVTLRAEFGTASQASAFGADLRSLLATVALLGERSPLGASFAKLKDAAVVKVEAAIVTLAATL